MMVETTHITKQYDKVLAVDRVNLQVAKGMVFGLLGPNGAGKTTMVRLLTGIIRPTTGSARVLDYDTVKEGDHIRQRCGVQTDTNLYEKLSARDNLLIWGRFFGMRGAQLRSRVADLLAQFDLEDRADDMVGTFSKGMKQKVTLARAIIHDPVLLFLDEPTAGLDPESSADLLEYLHEYVQSSERTVFLCSHRLEEVESLCQAVGIIHQGKLLAQGTPADLAAKIWQDTTFIIRLRQSAPLYAEKLKKNGFQAQAQDTTLLLTLARHEDTSTIIRLLVQLGADVLEAIEQKPRMHDIYFHFIPRGNNHEMAKHPRGIL